MAKWGRADYKALQKLQKNIEELSQKVNMDAFCEECSKELAARLLALVIPLTPVGDYNTYGTNDKGERVVVKRASKKGGTLKRGWGTDKGGAKAYAESLSITKTGANYTIEVVNPVEYASYVEFGHLQEPGRYVPAIGKQLKAGWVESKKFLTISEEKLEQIAPTILEKKLADFLKEAFNV